MDEYQVAIVQSQENGNYYIYIGDSEDNGVIMDRSMASDFFVTLGEAIQKLDLLNLGLNESKELH